MRGGACIIKKTKLITSGLKIVQSRVTFKRTTFERVFAFQGFGSWFQKMKFRDRIYYESLNVSHYGSKIIKFIGMLNKNQYDLQFYITNIILNLIINNKILYQSCNDLTDNPREIKNK